jgi:gluconate 2-dehydrogenase alpha chain
MFNKAAKNAGYHPFPRPSANASQPYTNPDGAKYGACQYCGYCQRFGCEANAKGSPHIAVIPFALANPNFELRTHSWVTKVLKDSDGKRVTGVTYTNVLNGAEFEQPARIVLLCAYALNNVHLMLLSGIGQPYDAAAQTGVVGRNYCYQTGTGATLFFEGRHFNPFMSAGGSNHTMDDFNINWDFDRGPLGFLGGYNVAGGFNTALPIGYRPVPRGTPQWGKAWKAATAKWYQTAMNIGASGSVMANRNNYLDLDPTYRDAYGQPLLRLTYNFHENDYRMSEFVTKKAHEILKASGATIVTDPTPRRGDFDPRVYQSTHNTGGTIMGADPKTSVLSPHLQHWDAENLFVVGASVYPHNSGYNPTGPLAALALRLGDDLTTYLQRPRRL